MKDAMDVLKDKVEQAESHNIQLMSYIDIFEKKEGLVYKGKDISAETYSKCFLSRAEIALWFGKSFGIEVQALNPLEPSVQYIGQQSHPHFFLSVVSLLDITRPLAINLACAAAILVWFELFSLCFFEILSVFRRGKI